MRDNKNMILAITLSALILLGWTWVSDKFFPPANPQSTKIVNGKSVPVPQPQAQPVPNTPKVMQSRAQVLSSTPRVRKSTARGWRGDHSMTPAETRKP